MSPKNDVDARVRTSARTLCTLRSRTRIRAERGGALLWAVAGILLAGALGLFFTALTPVTTSRTVDLVAYMKAQDTIVDPSEDSGGSGGSDGDVDGGGEEGGGDGTGDGTGGGEDGSGSGTRDIDYKAAVDIGIRFMAERQGTNEDGFILGFWQWGYPWEARFPDGDVVRFTVQNPKDQQIVRDYEAKTVTYLFIVDTEDGRRLSFTLTYHWNV